MKMKKYCPYCMAPIREGEACSACGLTEGSYTPAPHHLPPGTVLMERYLIGRVLGEGGFGITYIGCDLRLEMKVAIKEYFPTERVTRTSAVSLSVSGFTGVSEESYRQSKSKFLREARAMARMIKQPEIVGVRDYFEANNTAYIVMEFIDGTTMKALVEQRGGRIPAGELLHMTEPIFGALDVMHSAGLLHRDISPENLMLENGSIRLLDFGCARDGAAGLETLTISLKYGYAPVEQYQSKGQGPWTDVYALAATIYFCLTGKRPPQAMDRLVEDDLILPRKLGVDLTEKQERALLYGMGIHPRRRFRSMQEFHAALYEGVDWKEPAADLTDTNKTKTDPVAPSGKKRTTVIHENDEKSTTYKNSKKSVTTENTGKTTTPRNTIRREETADVSAWRTWITEHRTIAGAGAAAIAAILLLTVSLNVATKPKNTEPVSAPAETESITSETSETDNSETAKDSDAANMDASEDSETGSAAESGNDSAEESENETTGAAKPDTETDGIAIDEEIISAGIQSSREDGGIWLTSAEGDSLTLTLDTSVLEGLEYDSINWEVGDDASTGNDADADSYSENGNVLTLYGPEMYAQYESDGGLNVFWEVLGTDENNDTYVMYGGAVWVEIQAAEDSSEPIAAAYTVDSETAEQRRAEMEELFADAQTCICDNDNWEPLLTMLEDDSVSAIIIPSGTEVTLFQAATITKPVLVEDGAYLGAWNTLTIDGENACLYLKGKSMPTSVLRTVNGGRIVMMDDSWLHPLGALWLESESDLEILRGDLVMNEDQLLICSLDDTFDGSTEVSTAEEFLSALNDDAVSSITVTGEVTIDMSDDFAASVLGTDEEPGMTSLWVNVPVCIREGAALTVTGTTTEDGRDNNTWFDTGAVLINYGTLNMGVYSSAPVLNYGSWTGGITENGSILLNQGDLSVTGYNCCNEDGDGVLAYTSGAFYNEGTLTVHTSFYEDNAMKFGRCIFYNRGSITITGENTCIEFGAGVIAQNYGEIRVEDQGGLYNHALLTNFGYITVDGGDLLNEGVLYLQGGQLCQISGGVDNDAGLICLDSDDFEQPLELTDTPGGTIETLPAEGTDGCVTVQNAEELQAAMSDDLVQGILLEGEAEIDGDFTITKPFLQAGPLTVSGCLTIADGYLVLADCSLYAESITLEDGTFLLQQRELTASHITVDENAAFYSASNRYQPDWTAVSADIEIAQGGRMINLSPLTLEDSAITIRSGGELDCYGDLMLKGCTVNIESEGYLRMECGWHFDKNTTVTNDGWLSSWGFCQIEYLLAGTLTNNSVMTINRMTLSGAMENNGHLYTTINNSSDDIVEIQNNGEFLGNAVEVLADNQDWVTGEISTDE